MRTNEAGFSEGRGHGYAGNAPVPFDFEGRMVRVVMDENGEPWFVAKDACAILEHSNHRMAVQGLEDDEKGVRNVYTPGGEQEMLTVSESGLYALIFTSRKPEAKRFRKWVTSEVLPSLRKTGRYEIPGAARSEDGPLPEAARHLRPNVRAQVLTCAVQAAKMENGGPEAVDMHFRRFCFLVGARPAPMPRTLEHGPEAEHIRRFAGECCRPAAGQRVRAGKVYDAFCRWWRRRFADLAPTQQSFGVVMSRLYTNARRGGNVWYFDMALTGV